MVTCGAGAHKTLDGHLRPPRSIVPAYMSNPPPQQHPGAHGFIPLNVRFAWRIGYGEHRVIGRFLSFAAASVQTSTATPLGKVCSFIIGDRVEGPIINRLMPPVEALLPLDDCCLERLWSRNVSLHLPVGRVVDRRVVP